MLFDDLKKKPHLQELVGEAVAQFLLFCSVASCDSGILNMGELGIFAYILETDCDTCVRSQGLNLCDVYSQDVDSNSKSQLCGPSLSHPAFSL